MPKLGIFWMVPNVRGTLVVDETWMPDAEPYGDCLTHPRGHYEVWSVWQELGPAGLIGQGLPKEIAWIEYDDCPRGRIIYEMKAERFVIYADRRLQTPSIIAAIKARFDLTTQATIVRSDSHYT